MVKLLSRWANALRRVWHQPCWPLRTPLLPRASSDALLFRSSLLMSRPWVTRFSSRSAQGRRRMGSGGRGVSICPATWRSRDHLVPDSQRDHLVHRPHGNDAASALVRRKLEPLWLCGGQRRRCGLLAPAELAGVGPHAVQDHRQLASHGDAGTRHTPAFGDVHSPGAQGRPFGAADQQ